MQRFKLNFNETPLLAIWEVTQACDLACVHCRAMAQPHPLPGELRHEEGRQLIDAVAQMGAPIMVLSGGDPLKRPDLLALIRHGKQQGLRMGTIPAATPRLTQPVVRALKEAGLDQMALSVDASTAEAHDRFRGVPGAFHKTMEAIDWAHAAQLPLQINTVMSQHNADEIDALIACVEPLGIVFWEVFFLVPMGRGTAVAGLTAAQCERIFAKLYRLATRAPFMVKVTEAPHYRRHCLQQYARDTGTDPRTWLAPGAEMPSELRRILGVTSTIDGALHGVNAGKGFVFIAYNGDVFPSGFLPVKAGNVRRDSLAALYRQGPLFKILRNPDFLRNRCWHCEYRSLCGGSRSRTGAVSGDFLDEEPWCGYEPNTHVAPCG